MYAMLTEMARADRIASGDSYGWLITHDHLEGDGPDSEKGVSGPSDLGDHPDLEAALRSGKGCLRFKMYDDDGELYYSGRFINGCDDDNLMFGPLDDFGTPNAGCVRIDYMDPETKQWSTL